MKLLANSGWITSLCGSVSSQRSLAGFAVGTSMLALAFLLAVLLPPNGSFAQKGKGKGGGGGPPPVLPNVRYQIEPLLVAEPYTDIVEMNNDGMIVGWVSETAQSGDLHAFMYDHDGTGLEYHFDQIPNLADQLADQLGDDSYFSSAQAINMYGEIVGLAWDTLGNRASYLIKTGYDPDTGLLPNPDDWIVQVLDPASDFFPGDLVQASVTAGIQGTGGQSADPLVWQFRTAVSSGSGLFTDSVQRFVDESSTAVSLGDLDGDGDVDAFVASAYSNVWLNNGGLLTDSGQSLGNSPHDVVLGDLDGDGDLDAIATVYDGLRVWLNNGNGLFTDGGLMGRSGIWARNLYLSLGDLDGDGDLDVFVTHREADQVWLNDGSGRFSDSRQRLGVNRSAGVALGDLDGDGDLDAFVVTRGTYGPNRVWLNNGSGLFNDSGQSLGNHDSHNISLGDLDGDGDLDAFVANRSNQGDRVWLNNGSGMFADSGQNLGNHVSWAVSLGDLDGDGDLDAFVASRTFEFTGDPSGGNHIWLNQGGQFSDSGQSLGNHNSNSVSLGDLDGDGDLDAVVANRTVGVSPRTSQSIRVWLNQNLFPSVTLSVDNATIPEASGVATLTATLSAVATESVTVQLSFAGTAANGADFTPSSAQIVIPAGSSSGVATVTAVPDMLDEVDETVVVEIASVENGMEFESQVQTITIIDDDEPGPTVLSVNPKANTHLKPGSTDVVVNFDQAIDPDTVTFETLPLFSMQRGQLVDADVTVSGTSVTWDPMNDFFPGELVQAAATAGLQSSDGRPAQSRVWQFRTAVVPSSGAFSDSGQGLGNQAGFGGELGDLDGDGDLDAFIPNLGSGNRVWLNDAGVFQDSGQQLADHVSITAALGDLDGDGDLDAFVANVAQGNRVWLNEAGSFTSSGQILGDHWSLGVSLGDLDGDGDLDAFVTNDGQGNRVWLNHSDGHFSDSGQLLGDHDVRAVSLGDLDGDGDLDAFVTTPNENDSRIWKNDGHGVFADSGQVLGLINEVALGDLDGDGDLDAVGTSDFQSDRIWSNDGAGQFTLSRTLSGPGGFGIDLGDLDGDGDLDAFISNTSGDQIWLSEAGTFVRGPQKLGAGYGVALGDVDGDGDLDALTAQYYLSQVWLNDEAPPSLQVTSVELTDSGFVAQFSRDLDVSALNLYATQTLGPADVTFSGVTSGPIAGSLVVSDTMRSITFVKSDGPLSADDYTVVLRSGASGFKDMDDNALDGNGDATAGDDFSANLSLVREAAGPVTIGIPGFVRGPGQAVNVPATEEVGIPLSVSDGRDVKAIDVQISYDPTLLEISGANVAEGMPPGASVIVNTTTPGRLILVFFSATALPSGSSDFVHLQARVPATNPDGIHGKQQVLDVHSVTVSDGNDNEFPVIADDAVHLVSYLADVSANRRINASDAAQVARVAALIDDGFAASPLTDPRMIGDVSGNGRINAADASLVARFAALIPVPEIPPLPSGTAANGASRLAAPQATPAGDDEAVDSTAIAPAEASIDAFWWNTAFQRGTLNIALADDWPAEGLKSDDFATLEDAIDELFAGLDGLTRNSL